MRSSLSVPVSTPELPTNGPFLPRDLKPRLAGKPGAQAERALVQLLWTWLLVFYWQWSVRSKNFMEGRSAGCGEALGILIRIKENLPGRCLRMCVWDTVRARATQTREVLHTLYWQRRDWDQKREKTKTNWWNLVITTKHETKKDGSFSNQGIFLFRGLMPPT